MTKPTLDMSTVATFGGGNGVTVPSRESPSTAVMIFLHGLGDSGVNWAPTFPLPPTPYMETVLPNADDQPVTINNGFRSPSWFDLRGLDEDADEDEDGIDRAVGRIDRIVENQVRLGVPEHRIVVGGFSQGGALALSYGLRTERKLAGIVALSAWLPLRGKYPAACSHASKDLDIFMGHGTADQVITHSYARKSADLLQQMGRKVSFHSYPGLTHSASAAELDDWGSFLSRVVPRE